MNKPIPIDTNSVNIGSNTDIVSVSVQPQQFGSTHSLLMPSRGLTGSVMHLCGFTRLTKKPSIKVDLVIFSHVLGMSAQQCYGVALMLVIKLDFSSCFKSTMKQDCPTDHNKLLQLFHDYSLHSCLGMPQTVRGSLGMFKPQHITL